MPKIQRKAALLDECQKCHGEGVISRRHFSKDFARSIVHVMQCRKCGGHGRLPRGPFDPASGIGYEKPGTPAKWRPYTKEQRRVRRGRAREHVVEAVASLESARALLAPSPLTVWRVKRAIEELTLFAMTLEKMNERSN